MLTAQGGKGAKIQPSSEHPSPLHTPSPAQPSPAHDTIEEQKQTDTKRPYLSQPLCSLLLPSAGALMEELFYF